MAIRIKQSQGDSVSPSPDELRSSCAVVGGLRGKPFRRLETSLPGAGILPPESGIKHDEDARVCVLRAVAQAVPVQVCSIPGGGSQAAAAEKHPMKCHWILAAILCVPATVMAQVAVPSGTIIPISLDGSINAGKVHVGQSIRASVMQNVPGTAIRRRAHVMGHVIEANTAANGEQTLKISWDSVEIQGKMAPIRTNLRALASFIEVEQAQIPEDMSSRGMTPETWTTQQIGGDQFYRGGGPVAEGDNTVAKVTPWGALGVPRAQSGMPCRGAVNDNTRQQALWLFSVDACGLYGYPHLQISHYGRDDPQGTIALSSRNGKLKLGSGSAMLLRVL
jgi:hypothetical protein